MAKKKEPVKGIHAGGTAWNQVHASIAAYALDVLTARGYDGLTADAVAELGGIGRRTIYRHYPTRLDLALAAIRQMPALESTWQVDGSPRERLREAMRSASMLPLRLPQLLATAVTQADTTPGLLTAVLDDVIAPRRQLIADRLAEGKAGGWLRPDADEWEVSSLITGLLVNEALGLVSFPSRAARGDALADALWRQTAIDPDGDGTAPSRRSRK
jgi:AcrR family transcriptional regulator